MSASEYACHASSELDLRPRRRKKDTKKVFLII